MRTKSAGISAAEKAAALNAVVRPLDWKIEFPRVAEDGDVEVGVELYIHNGTHDRKGDTNYMTFYFDRGDITGILRAVQAMDKFTYVNELKKIAVMRDTLFDEVNLVLTEKFEDGSQFEDKAKKYEEVRQEITANKECYAKFFQLVKLETLMELLKRPKVFYSEEIQSLFA